MSNGWIGVDLDGTLANYNVWVNASYIGEPVPLMLKRVKKWIADGKDVRIFTARVSITNPGKTDAYVAIRDWCEKYIGIKLQITSEKDHEMIELWDDRCVRVETNTGKKL